MDSDSHLSREDNPVVLEEAQNGTAHSLILENPVVASMSKEVQLLHEGTNRKCPKDDTRTAVRHIPQMIYVDEA